MDTNNSTAPVNPTPVTPALDPAALQSQQSAAAQSANAVNMTVLVVEDEPDAREIFVDLLSTSGFAVISAVDGNDALAKLEINKNQVKLILLDIIMPNKDGVETLENIMANPEKYGAPVILMLTNIGGDAAIEKAMQLGAKGYLLKSETEPIQLVAEIKKYFPSEVPAQSIPQTGTPSNQQQVPPSLPMAA